MKTSTRLVMLAMATATCSASRAWPLIERLPSIEQHESRRAPGAAQPPRRERLAAGLQADPAACAEGRSACPSGPAASGATGPHPGGARGIARHRATRFRRASKPAHPRRRPRAGCSSSAREAPLSSTSLSLVSSGAIGPSRPAGATSTSSASTARSSRHGVPVRSAPRGRRRPTPGSRRAEGIWSCRTPAGPGNMKSVNARSKTVAS